MSDSDGDGISDDQDEYPTISTSDIELEIANFLNNADYFEIAFFLGIPNYENTLYDNRGFLSWYPDPIDRIRLIEIFRKHANTSDIGAYYEDLHACGYIVGDLSKNFLGLYKHIEFADLMLTCYELASQGTTFAEMSMLAYQSWAEDMKLVASIWLFGVTEQYCKQMAQWDYSPEYKLSLEQERSLKTYVNLTKSTKIEFSAKSDSHLTTVEGFKKSRQGIVGGHKLQAIEEYSNSIRPVKITQKTPGNVNGIYEIKYQVAKLDGAGNVVKDEFVNQTYTKTVYDSLIISDSQIMKYAREALESSSVQIVNKEMYVTGSASNGLCFEGWISNETGQIISYYPIVQ